MADVPTVGKLSLTTALAERYVGRIHTVCMDLYSDHELEQVRWLLMKMLCEWEQLTNVPDRQIDNVATADQCNQ